MTKYEIIELLAKERRVEKHVSNIAHSALNDELNDLCQLVYSILLESDCNTITVLWERRQLDFFMTRIILNQYRSTTSPFYMTFKRFRSRCIEITEYKEEDKSHED